MRIVIVRQKETSISLTLDCAYQRCSARQFDLSYSRLIDGLNKASIDIDRKVLADSGNSRY